MEPKPKPLSPNTFDRWASEFDKGVGKARTIEVRPVGDNTDMIVTAVEDGIGRTIFLDKATGEEV